MSVISSMTGQHFAYAYGRTGVLQQALLSRSDVDRMLGSSGRTDVEKIFTELKMTNMIDQSISSGEEVLDAVASWVRLEVEQMSPEEKLPVFQILWYASDGPLLSFMLKKRHNLISSTETPALDGIGSYDRSNILSCLDDQPDSTVPNELVQFVQTMAVIKNPTPQFIDASVSQFIANMQLQLAKKSGSKLIKQYVSHAIDLQNLKVALRNYDEESRKQALVEGGSIPVDSLLGSKEDILATIDTSDLSYNLSEAIKNADNPIALERACAEVLAADIAEMWNIPLSIEPLFAFAAIALSNLFLMRTVLIAKGNELGPQETKQILPPFIPATHYIL